jgi:hypothetical protein
MHSKPRLTASDPHRIGMSDAARAVLDASQRAYRERQAQMNGKLAPTQPTAKPAAKKESGDDRAVRMAIESARAERLEREATAKRSQQARLTLLSQVSGVPVSEVSRLFEKPA